MYHQCLEKKVILRCSLRFPSSFWGEDSVDGGERVWGVDAETWEHVLTGARSLGSGLFFFFFSPALALFFFFPFLICVMEISCHRSAVFLY